ncbi:MAG: Cof-type HAD-IIB family hydrolase [Bacillota bacterium]
MQYRLLAIDLDDTLLDEHSRISSRNRIAIQKALKKGMRLVIATGRMFRTSVPFMSELGLNDDRPLINFHGALVKKSQSREVILHRPIDKNIAIAVVKEGERSGLHVSVFFEDDIYVEKETEQSRYYQSLAKIEVNEVGSLSNFMEKQDSNPTKMSIIRWDRKLDSMEEKLKERFGSKLSILQSRPYFLEITDHQATKGQTLQWFAEREGIKREEIIAFGDGHNDLDMISYAGLGIAVANARPGLLKVADYITTSNNEDGVAAALEHFVL